MNDETAREQLSMAFMSGNLAIIERAAQRLEQVSLDDALRILAVMAEKSDARYARAAARWTARAIMERQLDLTGAQRALELTAQLWERPDAIHLLRQEYTTRSAGPPD